MGINWKTFLSPDYILHPDVVLFVKGNDGEEERTAAHRFLLAALSPVFGLMMQDASEMVRDKDTTAEAFASMINYVNRALGQEQFNLNDVEGPQMLFDLLELAEIYQKPDLKILSS